MCEYIFFYIHIYIYIYIRWMDGQTDERTDGRTDVLTVRLTDGGMDRKSSARTDGRTYRWTDVLTNILILIDRRMTTPTTTACIALPIYYKFKSKLRVIVTEREHSSVSTTDPTLSRKLFFLALSSGNHH